MIIIIMILVTGQRTLKSLDREVLLDFGNGAKPWKREHPLTLLVSERFGF